MKRFLIAAVLITLKTAFFLSCSGADNLAKKGLELLEQKKYLSALRYINMALEKDAENSLALFGKGQIMLAYEKTEDMALRMLKKSLEDIGEEAYKQKILLVLTDFYIRAKNAPQAENYYKLLLKNKQPDFDSSILEIRYLLLLNRRNETTEKISKLLTNNKEPRQLETLAQLLGGEIGDYKRCSEVYEQLIALNPKDKNYNFHLFNLQVERGEWVKAAELFTKLKQLDPGLYDEKQWQQNNELIKNKKWKADLSFLRKSEIR